MSLGQLLILHIMAGAGVAGGVYLATRDQGALVRWFQVSTALVFWPMYLPLLLQKPRTAHEMPPPLGDDLEQTVSQVNGELAAAVTMLERRFGSTLSGEIDRLRDLRGAWGRQIQCIREMDQLLNRPADPLASTLAGSVDDDLKKRLSDSREALEENRQMLRQTRQRQFANLLGALTESREMVSSIHLAAYSNESADRLRPRIAAAINSLLARLPAGEQCIDHDVMSRGDS